MSEKWILETFVSESALKSVLRFPRLKEIIISVFAVAVSVKLELFLCCSAPLVQIPFSWSL